VNYLNDDWDYEAAINDFNLDIMNGKIPDIIDSSYSYLDAEVYASKGMLCDLYDMIDNDPEVSRDDFVSSLLKSYESNGKLYKIPNRFYIETLVGLKDYFGDKSGFTFEEFNNICNSKGKNVGCIENLGSADVSAIMLLGYIFTDDFIDWGKGTCCFDSDEFKALLKFAKDYDDLHTFTGEGIKTRIAKGEIIASYVNLSSVADYQIQKIIYGDDLSIVGFPTGDGYGSIINGMGVDLAGTESWKGK
jgi:maltose-binding protein MalE